MGEILYLCSNIGFYNKKVTGCNGLILKLLTGEMEDFDSMSDEVLFRLYFFYFNYYSG